MNPLKIPIPYIKESLLTHINAIDSLNKQSKFKINKSVINSFILDVYTKTNLTDKNKDIVAYGILYTLENILINQNITHPFGVNSKNSIPISTKTYEFDIKKGVYHSHILEDKKTKQNIVLIWYILKEDEDINIFTIKFRYMPHPSIAMYKSIIKDIEKEDFSYNIGKNQYMIDTLFENGIYNYNEFINKRGQ